MKIVINSQYGGFGLSVAGVRRYAELKGIEVFPHEENLETREVRLLTGGEAEKMNSLFISWATKKCKSRAELNANYFSFRDIPRDDPALVQTVEELGKAASGKYSSLKVVEIPDDVEWQIEEYDGVEWIAEKHRTWS